MGSPKNGGCSPAGDMPGSWSLRPWAWLLFAGITPGLCSEEPVELTPDEPSKNVLFFDSRPERYKFDVRADNSRLEFRVTLTEEPKDLLDVYLSDQPIDATAPELSKYSVMSGPVVTSTSNEDGSDCVVDKQCMIYVLSVSPCVVKKGVTYYALVQGTSITSVTKAKVRYEEVSAELEPSVPVSRYVSYHEPVARRWHYFSLTPAPDKGALALSTSPGAAPLRSLLPGTSARTLVPLPLAPSLHRPRPPSPFPSDPHPCPAKADPPGPPPRCPPPAAELAVPCRSGRHQPDHLRQLRPGLHGPLRRQPCLWLPRRLLVRLRAAAGL